MGNKKIYKTDHLFSSSGFLEGIGSVIAIGGNYHSFNTSKTPHQADADALKSDWGVVGNDLRKAIGKK